MKWLINAIWNDISCMSETYIFLLKFFQFKVRGLLRSLLLHFSAQKLDKFWVKIELGKSNK